MTDEKRESAARDLPKVLSLGEGCCGCGACAAACVPGALAMEADGCGFLYPRVAAERCVGCGACDRTCPVLGAREGKAASEGALGVWWARAKDGELVGASSSGGVFGLLSASVLSAGGSVYGAAWEDDCRRVSHRRISADDSSQGVSLRKSKYVQSAVGAGVYRALAEDLARGLPVLFSGTACQVEAARRFAEARCKDTSGLLLVDVICHGAPSPKLWGLWASEQERILGAPLESVSFRDKRTGWEDYSVTYRARSGCDASSPWDRDWFMAAFLRNASLRPSCLQCPFKRACGSDVTLGDFWGIREAHPEVSVGHGVSAVVARTERGKTTFLRASGQMDLGASEYGLVLRGNPSLAEAAKPYARYGAFQEDLAACSDARRLRRRWGFGLSLGERVAAKLRRWCPGSRVGGKEGR